MIKILAASGWRKMIIATHSIVLELLKSIR
jgi:hypothetical protein